MRSLTLLAVALAMSVPGRTTVSPASIADSAGTAMLAQQIRFDLVPADTERTLHYTARYRW